jgi:thiamine-phosphate pyrophosphorylase
MKRSCQSKISDDASVRYYRVFDANLNRSREGLRVIEDTARFVLEDAQLYKQARSLRHRLDKATRKIYTVLLHERDAHADAGRVIKEGKRESINAVLSANFRRVEESMRVLEEYSRMVIPPAGAEFKAIRFATYILEKKVAGMQMGTVLYRTE